MMLWTTMSSKAVIAVLAFYVLAQTNAYEESYSDGNEEMRKYCGKKIAETLNKICNTDFIKMNRPPSKKSIPMYDTSLGFEYDGTSQYQDDDSIFLNKIAGLSRMPNHFRRNRRGIVDECCRKSCSLAELSAYCPVPLKGD